jgi:hypothetical protein
MYPVRQGTTKITPLSNAHGSLSNTFGAQSQLAEACNPGSSCFLSADPSFWSIALVSSITISFCALHTTSLSFLGIFPKSLDHSPHSVGMTRSRNTRSSYTFLLGSLHYRDLARRPLPLRHFSLMKDLIIIKRSLAGIYHRSFLTLTLSAI